jgi:acyl-CoA synthetase (AMP-forming)/AMP-acid ligase II
MLTHRSIAANIVQSQVCLDVKPDDVLLAVLPFFHVMGQTCVMATSLAHGAPLVVLSRFDLEQALQAIQEYRVTVALVVPPVMNALARHPAVDRYDLSSLRLVASGAAPLGAETEEAVAARLGCMTGQGFGMTEASAIVAGPSVELAESRRGSSGRLVSSTEARIVDPATGAALGPGESGELWIRGPQVFAGYLNRPDATADTLDADGWLHSGDVAHFDEDGYLFVTDRIKELIKVNAYQVAPAELEALLLTHPAVADAAVIGRPDDESGEVPVAFVVPAGDLDVDELIEWVTARVARYKRVRAVEILEEIPKSPSGKILRRLLRDQTSMAASR